MTLIGMQAEHFEHVCVGPYHTFAIHRSGRLWAFGAREPYADVTPVPAAVEPFAQLLVTKAAAGFKHMLAVASNGRSERYAQRKSRLLT